MRVAGFGYRSGAEPSSLRAAWEAALAALRAEGLAEGGDGWTGDPACHGRAGCVLLAAPQDKLAMLQALAAQLGLPVRAVSAMALRAAPTVTHSPASLAARGTGSVAEASALVAAGPGARLLVTRRISADRRASCAIAEGTDS